MVYRVGGSIIFLSLILLSTIVNGQASVVVGSASTSRTNYSPGVGNNRLLVVSVANETNNNVGSIVSITWGGQALTFATSRNNAGSGSNDLRAEIWYLNEAGINAASGLCNTFVVTWSGTVTAEAFAVHTLKDVDQTTPVSVTAGAAIGSATVTLPSTAVGTNDILFYATATQASSVHSQATGYAEHTDQVVSATMGLATASKQIPADGNETPTATWSVSSQILMAVVVFNGVTETGPVTYYSRNATLGGAWNANTSWTTNSNGTGGPLVAGVWPRRQDNVVILPGHTITVNAVNANRSCGVSPDNLLRSNVGPFPFSNIAMFYHTGDITIRGTFTVTGIEIMIEGYTHLLTGGTFSPTSFLVNTGYLEVDAGTTLTGFNSLVLTGNSTTIINTSSSFVDDLIIDHTNATLCGTGSAQLQNGSGSIVSTTNSGSLNQICSSFTVTCTGSGCAGFPVAGTGSGSIGSTGPGGVGSTDGSSSLKIWFKTDLGINVTGTTINSWANSAGVSALNISEAGGQRPTLVANALNGFSEVSFSGANRLRTGLTLTTSNFVSDMATSFLVNRADNTTQSSSIYLTDPLDVNRFSNHVPWLDVVYYDIGDCCGTDARMDVGSLTGLTGYSLWTYAAEPATGKQLYRNGAFLLDRPNTSVYSSHASHRFNIGGNTTGTQGFVGDITELIIFNVKINTAQRLIIDNYLSAKYGLTLSSNDLYTMDNSGNGNFDYEVAGIGQATDGSSHKDARGSGVVRVVSQSPSSITNGEFFMWGHDGAPLNSHIVAGGDVDGTIIQERLRRVWRVSEVGDVGTVAISFDINSLLTPLGANLRLLVDRDGDGFADNDITPQGGGTYVGKVITFTGVNLQNGDRFTLGNTNVTIPLPVELLSFTAAAEGSSVKLAWSTASEIDNDYFLIQRSLDAETWEDVSRIKGADNKSTRTDYERTDNNPHQGASYYRLKQVDWDGEYSYSQIRRVEVTEAFALKAYPNPTTSGSFRVVTGFEIESEDVQLVDMMGKPVSLKISKDDEEGVLIETINPSPGIYVLHVAKGYWKQTLRVIIR